MKKILIVLVNLIVSKTVSAQCFDGPQLLNASFRKIAFFDENNGFAFGQGTLMKTNDGSQNWNFIPFPNTRYDTEPLKSYSFLNSTSAVIVGQKGTIIKTTDLGQSWNSLSLGINGNENINSVDFINENIGYATAYTSTPQQRYFMKTTNGGASWTQIPTYFNSYINFYSTINIHFLSETVGFAWSGKYLFKTMDGGNTWTELQNPSGTTSSNQKNITDLKVSENGTIVLSCYDSLASYYKSTDNGASWQFITDLTPSNNIYNSLGIFDVKNNKIMLVGAIGMTTNLSFISYDLTSNQITSNQINTRMGYQSDIFFVNSTVGYIIDRGYAFWTDTPGRKILKTSDGGITWNEFDSFALINPSSTNIKVLTNGPNTLTLTKQDDYDGSAYDFNLYTSVDNGATWQLKLTANNMYCNLLKAENNYISYLRFANPTNGAEGFSLYESFDLGVTWTHSEFLGVPNSIINSFEQLDMNTLRCGLNSEIYLSFDKGQNWINVPMPVIPNVVFYYSKIKNMSEIYAWGKYNQWPSNYDYYLYKTDNLGQSWQLITSIPDNNGIDLGGIASNTFFGSNYAIVSTGGNTYFKVNLDNSSYIQIPFNHPVSNQVYLDQNRFKILDDNKWLFVTENGYKTSTDQGVNWTDKACMVCSTKTIYDNITGTLISYDSDHAVERIGNYSPSTPTIYGNSISQINQTETYFVAQSDFANVEWILVSGGIITENNGNLIEINWLESGQHILKAKYINSCGESSYCEFIVTINNLGVVENSIQKTILFPNPFKDQVTIESEILSLNSEIKIFTPHGQLVYFQNFNSSHTVILSNLEYLKKGTYFLTINNNNGTHFFKLIKN
ncbi:YCF48-related protein [Flavobacterium sedimenticola]|uniref:YCF48-related protein n=1 Tax=Flavobacterium sedimenticola TaxID=3043286 RepID=A0ABT6XQR1_9FLAO|nr:YCF48-related protein [Flavobacterium sedimenticola]MDI9257406.1 YCF48-related protein [Flavobacterium sedimenticola]